MAKLSEKFKPGDRVWWQSFGGPEYGVVCDPQAITSSGETVQQFTDRMTHYDTLVWAVWGTDVFPSFLREEKVEFDFTQPGGVRSYGHTIKIDAKILEKDPFGKWLDTGFLPAKPSHTHSWKPYYGLSNFVQGYDCDCGERKGT